MVGSFVKFIYTRALKDGWDLSECQVRVVFYDDEPHHFSAYRNMAEVDEQCKDEVLPLQEVINKFGEFLNG